MKKSEEWWYVIRFFFMFDLKFVIRKLIPDLTS